MNLPDILRIIREFSLPLSFSENTGRYVFIGGDIGLKRGLILNPESRATVDTSLFLDDIWIF